MWVVINDQTCIYCPYSNAFSESQTNLLCIVKRKYHILYSLSKEYLVKQTVIGKFVKLIVLLLFNSIHYPVKDVYYAILLQIN